MFDQVMVPSPVPLGLVGSRKPFGNSLIMYGLSPHHCKLAFVSLKLVFQELDNPVKRVLSFLTGYDRSLGLESLLQLASCVQPRMFYLWL